MHASGNQSLLIVKGMHRSGTSALCAALAACGVSFGERLIEAMAGVNDEGFWEDARVVALNEQLLALTDSTWYAPAPGLAGIDWTQECFQDLRQQAAALLEAGFGESAWGAVKDPRFCLTLRFWLDVGNDLGLATRVCAIGRVPLEVARSLQRRDGFPPGYGLRLCSAYRGLLLAALPADALQVDYDALLADTPATVGRLAEELALAPDPQRLAVGVRAELRHQRSESSDNPLAELSVQGLAQLDAEIAGHYPAEQVLAEFAREQVARGLELSRVGAAHSQALATIAQRDADVAALAAEHREALSTLRQRDADIDALASEHRVALATLDERDEQIREFDRRLAKIGEEHSHALEVIRERDAQVALLQERLDYIYNLPGVGFVIRQLRKHHARG